MHFVQRLLLNESMQTLIKFDRKKHSDYEFGNCCQCRLRVSKLVCRASKKCFRFSTRIRLCGRYLNRLHDLNDSRPDGFDVWRLLIGLLLRGLSLPCCTGPVHQIVCDRMSIPIHIIACLGPVYVLTRISFANCLTKTFIRRNKKYSAQIWPWFRWTSRFQKPSCSTSLPRGN